MKIMYVKGRVNKRGEKTPWVIIDVETGTISGAYPSRLVAEKNMAVIKEHMEFFRKRESILKAV